MKENNFLMKAVLLAGALILLGFSASADSFGTASGNPLPNVTNVTVHDVTGLSISEKETGGSLEDYGLNSTLTVNQEGSTREYRVTFEIVNDGSETWNIADNDELFHDGLNSSWTVNKIWYNISQDYDSGTFQSGKVSWNTSKGGSLSSGSVMYAKYLVEPTVSSSQYFQQSFEVNDTSNNTGSTDQHDLDLNKLGYLNMTLQDPPNDTVVTQNKTFIMNASIECLDGECGSVTASARYNQSASADTLIPENSGEPFHTDGVNTKQCDSDLVKDETCLINWTVNATGTLESYHELDVNASSSYDAINSDNTEDHLVQINMAVLLNVTWNTIDFGVLSPGAVDKPAQGNSDLSYNLSVESESNTVDDLWIRSTDLQSQERDSYSIGAGNISYSLTDDISTETNVSNSYQHVKSDISPGSVLNTFYWIDVPTGIYKGGYNGTIYFKGNSTR